MDVSVLLAFGVFVVLMLASFGKHVSHNMEHEVIKNWESDAIDLERHIGFKARSHLSLSTASLQKG